MHIHTYMQTYIYMCTQYVLDYKEEKVECSDKDFGLWNKRGYESWFYFFFFCFLGSHLRHMDVPRLRIESELQPPAYTTATAPPDPS